MTCVTAPAYVVEMGPSSRYTDILYLTQCGQKNWRVVLRRNRRAYGYSQSSGDNGRASPSRADLRRRQSIAEYSLIAELCLTAE